MPKSSTFRQLRIAIRETSSGKWAITLKTGLKYTFVTRSWSILKYENLLIAVASCQYGNVTF